MGALGEIEEGARYQLAELETIYRFLPIGLCFLDRDLRYVKINERLAGFHSRAISEHIGRTVREAVPEIADTLEPLCRQALSSGQPLENVEFHGIVGSPAQHLADWIISYYPVKNPEGRILGINIAVSDITSRKQAEEAMLWREKKYRALIERGSDLISLLDARGIILYKSPSITRVLGFSSEELVGHHAFEVAHPDEHPHLAMLFEKLLREPEKTLLGEFRHLAKDGSWHWMEGIATNMLADPAVQAIVFNYRDITERKLAETALQAAQKRIQEHACELERRVAERTRQLEESMRSLQGILYHVAHDLRAPLRAIQAYTGMLVNYCTGNSNPAAREHGASISAAVKHMDTLIQDLLGFGRLGHMELPAQKLDLKLEMGVVLGRMSQEIKAKGAEVMVTEPLPAVWANPGALKQILANLIENALKYVATGVAPRVQIRAAQEGNGVRISIQDNGIGVEAQYQEKIFGVFERLHESQEYPGTGIGLAIVRKAAERMGGRAGVESKPGVGSTFWVELPLAAPDPKP